MTRNVSRETGRSFLIGVVAIAVLGVIIYVALTANQGRLPGTPTTVVRAEFANVGQLKAGSEVRENSVYVGHVSQIQLRGATALVTMELNGDVPMYADARAGIWDQSALGQKFVELRPGSQVAGSLGNNVIPTTQTESTHDLVDVLDVFEPRTRAALGSSLRALGGIAGYGPGLHDFIAGAPRMLGNVGQVATTLSSEQSDLPALLRTSDRLSSRFAGREAQITSLLAQTDETVQALDVDNGQPLEDTLKQLPRTLRDARRAFDGVQLPLEDTRRAMSDVRSGARALGDATPDLRGVLREGVTPLNTVPHVADSAGPAVDELTHVFADARPFVPRLADGLSSAAVPLAVLGPYAKDIGTFAFDLGSLVSNHNGWEHRLRVMFGPPVATSVLGQVLPDTRDAYPAPGQAIRERDANGGLIPGPGR
jgi:phospholipid/cholesterol/gamma-HCH transport system substrate-binding protein